MIKQTLIFLLFMSLSAPAFSWRGIDEATGRCVNIGKGNLCRPDLDIKMYDCADAKEKKVTVIDIYDLKDYTAMEVLDDGRVRYLKMEIKRKSTESGCCSKHGGVWLQRRKILML